MSRHDQRIAHPLLWSARALCLAVAAVICTPLHLSAATLTATTNLRPNMAVYKPGETVTIQFSATGATVGWTLKITVKNERETVLATQNYNVTSSTWSQSYTAPNPKLGFYRVYASLYNGSTEVQKLTAANSSRPNGYLTYAIVPNPAQRLASIPDTQAAFGMQGGFHQNVGTDIFALLGLRWSVDGGWKWKDLSPSISQKFNGSNPPAAFYTWATNGAGGPWTVYNMPNLTKDGRPYGGSPDVYKAGTFAYNTGALKPEYEQDWSNFCAAVADSWPTVYPNRTRPMYEITWEPVQTWGYAGTDADLVRLYQLAYPAIKGADSNAWVLGPCMHINHAGNVAENEQLLALGLGNYIDAFTAHPYMDSDNGWNLRSPELAGQPSLLRTMKNKLRAYTGRDVPMLGTEQGYRTRVATNPVTQPALGTQPNLTAELAQAQRLIRSQLLTLGEGWKLNIAFYVADYPTNDSITGSPYWDWGFFYNLNTASFGGYGPDKISPKPVVPAYAAMTYLLENRRSTCDINWLGNSVRGYAFQRYDNANDVILALWNFQPAGTSADQVTINTGVAQVDVYDWMGNKTTQTTSSGSLTVTLSEQPIYIKGVSASLWGSARPNYNIALGKPVTVSSQASGSNAGALAVDGDSVSHLSRWVSQSGFAAQWIEVNLGSSQQINEVRFWTGEYSTGPNGPLGLNTYQLPLTSYQIQRWDGSAWVNIISRTSNTKAVVAEKFTAVTTSKVRLYVPASTVNAVNLYEVEVLRTTPVPPASTVTLTSVADAQVRGGLYTTNNYGTSTTMRARYDGPTSDENYESFVRFNLSSITGTITQAKLRLHPVTVGIWQNAPVNRLFRVNSDTWNEATVTWHTKPASDATVLGQWTPAQSVPSEIDITSVVQAEKAGDSVLSLKVIGVNWDGANVYYGAHEHATASVRPALVVTTSN